MPQEIAIKNLIFVDCEGHGPAPTLNDPVSFEFGAVAYPSKASFHGVLENKRIGDFYAGLVGNFIDSNSWKKLRITPHDHNHVNDAMGNLEAFEKLLNGER